MITQQLDNASELSTGQEVETIYITDEELESLTQELAREYENVIGTD